MDRFVASFPAVADRDLMVSVYSGCAYQADMSSPVPYDDAYFDKYVGYEGQDIARKINKGRVALVNTYAGSFTDVLDVGIGSGEFIKSRNHTFGIDVNKKAMAWLREHGRAASSLAGFRAYSFWDVLEHIETPENYFNQMAEGSYLFTSIPVFGDIQRVRNSKHYRPNEHFYYWTEAGFVDWMRLYNFRLLERDDFETEAGREDIVSFAFRRLSK